jgi:hypothetical protein
VRITLLSAMIGVGSAFAIVLTAGFRFRKDFDGLSDGQFAVAIVLALVVIAFATTFAVSGLHFKVLRMMGRDDSGPGFNGMFDWTGQRSQQRMQGHASRARDIANHRLAQDLRVASLSSDPDPARRKYASMVERGEHWNDDQIAYNENIHLTGTCEHLKNIERAMRTAGVRTRLTAQWEQTRLVTLPKISADCRVDVGELWRRFRRPVSVQYLEGFMPERAAEDNPWASLTCAVCGSSIELVHSKYGRPETPGFPSGG